MQRSPPDHPYPYTWTSFRERATRADFADALDWAHEHYAAYEDPGISVELEDGIFVSLALL